MRFSIIIGVHPRLPAEASANAGSSAVSVFVFSAFSFRLLPFLSREVQ